jgi:hypothetical protein
VSSAPWNGNDQLKTKTWFHHPIRERGFTEYRNAKRKKICFQKKLPDARNHWKQTASFLIQGSSNEYYYRIINKLNSGTSIELALLKARRQFPKRRKPRQ